jgi:hypothetical protein
MVWLSMLPGEWRKAQLHGLGGTRRESVALVTNPFDETPRSGMCGQLCTGATVWACVVVVSEWIPHGTLTLRLEDCEPYDEDKHGPLTDDRTQKP